MILFGEYFAEHSIHTLKLSLDNFQKINSPELTNMLKPFEAINVIKLKIEVSIPFIPINYCTHTILNREKLQMHSSWQF